MGGRGASSGVSTKGKKYGTEYRMLFKVSNIKFIKTNPGEDRNAPMETMTKGRVYAYVGTKNNLKSIIYFDENNKRIKQIDLTHFHNGIKPHAHIGYEHKESEARRPTDKERRLVDFVKRAWENKYGK